MPTVRPLPSGDILALYNGGNWKAYMTPAFRTRLERVRVDGYLIHAGPRGLLGTDPDHPDPHDPTALIAWLREVTPNAQIWLGVGLDGWTRYLGANMLPKASHDAEDHATPEAEATVLKLFRGIALLAVAANAVGVTPDAESESKVQPSAGRVIARLFFEAFRAVAPAMVIAHTAFDGPVGIEYPPGSHHNWGGQSPYPLKSWLGDSDPEKRADASADQNYVAYGKGRAPQGALQERVARSIASFAQAVVLGLCAQGMRHIRYLQVHGTPCNDTIDVAIDESLMIFWAAGTPGSDETFDDEGELALARLTKLRRLGYRGPGAKARFLAATHTSSGPTDHEFGPKAFAALSALQDAG